MPGERQARYIFSRFECGKTVTISYASYTKEEGSQTKYAVLRTKHKGGFLTERGFLRDLGVTYQRGGASLLCVPENPRRGQYSVSTKGL